MESIVKTGVCDKCGSPLPKQPWRNDDSEWTGFLYCSEDCAGQDTSIQTAFEVYGVYDGVGSHEEVYQTWEEQQKEARILAEDYAQSAGPAGPSWEVYTQEVYSDGESECSLGQKSDMRPDYNSEDDTEELLDFLKDKYESCVHQYSCSGHTCVDCIGYRTKPTA